MSDRHRLDPTAIAQRTLAAIRGGRFYVLPPDGDPWRIACDARLDAIRHARNPGSAIAGQGEPTEAT